MNPNAVSNDDEFKPQLMRLSDRRRAANLAKKLEERRRISEAVAKQFAEDRKCEFHHGLFVLFIAMLVGIITIPLESTGIITQDYKMGICALAFFTSIFGMLFVCGCRF